MKHETRNMNHERSMRMNTFMKLSWQDVLNTYLICAYDR